MKWLLSELDLYDKTENSELSQETAMGKYFTVVTLFISSAAFLMNILGLIHTKYYRELVTEPRSFDETDLVNISLSVYVDMPCYFLHVDSLDSLGVLQHDLNTTITLRRMNEHGVVMGRTNATMSTYCGPCYGLLGEDQCCDSCQQLMVLAMIRGVPTKPKEWEQCRSLSSMPKDVSPKEKCMVKGKITVNKVAGDFHIAAGRNVRGAPGHQHDLSGTFPNLELKHRIDRIRFGDKIPTASSPLVDVVRNLKGGHTVCYRYFMMVTPVQFYRNGQLVKSSYEYTAYTARWQRSVPGIFFSYQFSPYSVAVHMVKKNVIVDFVSTCGFLAGVFAVCTMAMEWIEKKEEEAKEI